MNLAQIRSDYQMAALDEKEVGEDPVRFFEKWLLQAESAGVSEVNAMSLSTVDDAGKPHSRIVLLKGLEDGGFIFFTNYRSAKGRQIAGNENVALLFFWKELERQVRIEGIVERVTEKASDEYFHARPTGSQMSAIVSPQSQVIRDRSELEEKVRILDGKYAGLPIPRPDYWGGYKVWPNYLEFWQGRSNRLHDRIAFLQTKEQNWVRHRLAP